MIIMVIATTRMHRSLVKYAGTPSSSTTVYDTLLGESSLPFPFFLLSEADFILGRMSVPE